MKKGIYILSVFLLFSCKQDPKNTVLSGSVFGTSYAVQYYSDETTDFQQQFDSLFNVINKSMSTYIPDSDISKINRNESNTIDTHFAKVFDASKEIYKQTEGVFDPT